MRLGPEERSGALRRLTREVFEVLVVGGGVTGCGCALDAAGRGLSVALVEQRDYAAGTSSRSSKLIHGGLRYLEQRDFGLVREALTERSLLLRRLAPHLVRPVPFLFPLRHRVWERAYIGAGVLLYDLMGGAGAVPRHRHLGRGAALAVAPALRGDRLVGAIRYYDAQVDDARYTVTLARTAAASGAVLASSVRVVGFCRRGERIVGVEAVDVESGLQLEIAARVVIAAVGVWTDELLDMAGGSRKIRVRASKGVHLVVPRERIRSDSGIILRTETSVLFVIPWRRHWLIGTTDTDWNLDLAHPAATRPDIEYLLEHVNAVLASPLRRDDVIGVYAGLRPLLAGESEATSELSRRHAVTRPAPGLVAVAGGKYTTYRVMARDAVDAAAADLERPVPASRTDVMPLLGAKGFRELAAAPGPIAARGGLAAEQVERLLSRYGTAVVDLVDSIVADPQLGRALPGGGGYLEGEIVYAASHEGALHLDDVLTRRTRISIEERDRGLAAAEPAAHLMATVLGWDGGTVRREIKNYRARIDAERRSQAAVDDADADAARLSATDSRSQYR